jgi:hypothetical protein
MRRVEEGMLALAEPPVERLDVGQACATIRRAVDEAALPQHRPSAGRQRVRLLAAALVLVLAASLVALFRHASSSGETGTAPQAPVLAGPARQEPAEDEVTRLARLRGTLREHLLLAFEGIGEQDDAQAAAADFDELCRDLHRKWSLLRNVEALVEDPRPAVARAALRYLGVRGDSISTGVLRQALARSELRACCLAALGDLGRPAVGVLAELLGDAELWKPALERLCEIGGREAARSIEEQLADASVGETRARLLMEGLGSIGAPAVESFLRLASRPGSPAPELMGTLVYVQGARDELVRFLEEEHEGVTTDALLQAVTLLQPDAALGWLRELSEGYELREPALDCLREWDGAALALPELRRLYVGGRVPRERVVEVALQVILRDPLGSASHAEHLIEEGEPRLLQDLYELLLACEHRAAGEALAVLALADVLPADQRQWAALAVGELRDRVGMERLADGLPALDVHDRRLMAACLVTVHEVGGRELAEEALHQLPIDEPTRILAALEGSRGGALGLNRVARELSGRLITKETLTRRASP